MNLTGRRLLAFALVTFVALGVAWAGRVSEGRRAIVEADAALARADLTDAILYARIAAEARCPGCTAPAEGFARLERIAHDAETRGDDTVAFAAWRAARAAVLATAVSGGSDDRRARADAELARFGHRLDVAAVAAGATPTPAAAEDRLRTALGQNELPGGTTFAIIAVGGLLFLVAGARFAMPKAGRSRTDLALAVLGASLAALGALFF